MTLLYRSGTPDTPAAAACAEALKLAVQKLPERTEHIRKLNQFLRENLLQNSGIRISSRICQDLKPLLHAIHIQSPKGVGWNMPSKCFLSGISCLRKSLTNAKSQAICPHVQ